MTRTNRGASPRVPASQTISALGCGGAVLHGGREVILGTVSAAHPPSPQVGRRALGDRPLSTPESTDPQITARVHIHQRAVSTPQSASS